LQRKAGLSVARARAVRKAAATGAEIVTLDQQLALFRELYPEGFQSEDWEKDVRGIGKKRALKKHRQPVLEAARELLSEERLGSVTEDEAACVALKNELHELLDSTNLVSKKDRELMAQIPPRDLVHALRDLLFPEDTESDYMTRHDVFIRWMAKLAGRRGLSWPVATFFAAVAQPTYHICIRPTSCKVQAVWMAPKLKLKRQADAEQYQQLLAMTAAVEAKLREAGFQPRDLMDVYDFMWITLKPAARKRIAEMEASSVDSTEEDVGVQAA
jgi:hypothetical protein